MYKNQHQVAALTRQENARTTYLRMLLSMVALLSMLLVSQVTVAQSQFDSLPYYNQYDANPAGAYAVLGVRNNSRTDASPTPDWQFDVSKHVSGLRGGQCNSINLNRKIMGWMLLQAIGPGDFTFNVQAYNRFGNLVGVGSQQVSLGHGRLRGIQIDCLPSLGPPPIPAPQPLPIPLPIPVPPPAPVIDIAALEELDLNLRMWQLQNVSDYSIVSSRFCFCIRESTLPGRVEVRNDQVISKTFVENGRTIPSQYADSFFTVRDAFSLVRRAILDGADSIDVTYDAFYGFPSHISIDYIARAIDDEITVQLSEFRPLSGGYLPPIIPTPIPTPLPPIGSPPVASCQPHSYGYQTGESVDIIKDNGTVWACVRGSKPNPCSTIDLVADRSGSQFNIYSRAIDSGRICAQVIAPFAKLIQLDTSHLGYGVYPVSYYPLHSQGNVVSSRFSLP